MLIHETGTAASPDPVHRALKTVYGATFRWKWDDARGRRFLADLPPGETPMPGAPTAEFAGTTFTPQQYLVPRHTVATVQQLLSRVSHDEHVRLFAFEDPESPGSILLQVGLLGPDSYAHEASRPTKLLYGRVWRVEPHLPTSEILQTAFKAIGDALEHEVREALRWKGYTVFNNHVDLPMLARTKPSALGGTLPNPAQHLADADAASASLTSADVAGSTPQVAALHRLAHGDRVYEITLRPDPSRWGFLRRYWPDRLSVLAHDDTLTSLLYGLMDALLAATRAHVAATFRFDGESRFDRRTTSVPLLLAFQRQTRSPRRFRFSGGSGRRRDFAGVASAINRAIDATRRPRLGSGPLDEATRRWLATQQADGELQGFLPIDDRPRPQRKRPGPLQDRGVRDEPVGMPTR